MVGGSVSTRPSTAAARIKLTFDLHAMVISHSFRARLLCVLETFPNHFVY